MYIRLRGKFRYSFLSIYTFGSSIEINYMIALINETQD